MACRTRPPEAGYGITKLSIYAAGAVPGRASDALALTGTLAPPVGAQTFLFSAVAAGTNCSYYRTLYAVSTVKAGVCSCDRMAGTLLSYAIIMPARARTPLALTVASLISSAAAGTGSRVSNFAGTLVLASIPGSVRFTALGSAVAAGTRGIWRTFFAKSRTGAFVNAGTGNADAVLVSCLFTDRMEKRAISPLAGQGVA